MGSRSETFAESTFRAIKCGQNAGKIQTRVHVSSRNGLIPLPIHPLCQTPALLSHGLQTIKTIQGRPVGVHLPAVRFNTNQHFTLISMHLSSMPVAFPRNTPSPALTNPPPAPPA